MRTFSHWTPIYIKNRIGTLYYEKAYPEYPWLTRDANEILASYLVKNDIGLEFGSGRIGRRGLVQLGPAADDWLGRHSHTCASLRGGHLGTPGYVSAGGPGLASRRT